MMYQAVCELEDFRGGASGSALATSVLIGPRGDTKQRAFEAALKIATAV